ncbi:MAG: transglycosylase SLT domain-containing protein [Gammaproteobacteria bacterium]|nr:transglycosylase SLT domain-containing protein [Gammaproteobacteria bacterium]
MNKLSVKSINFDTIRLFASVLVAICVLSLSGQSQASIERQRLIFHDASTALKKNQFSKFNRLLKQLEGYPAQAYLKYDDLKRRIHKASRLEVTEFLNSHEEYPFNYHLRAKWLSVLARRKDWTNYLMYFDNRENTRYQCLAFQARLNLGIDEGINQEIIKVWLRGYSQPRECDQAFEYFLETYPDTNQVIWLRIDKAFKARRPSLAKYLGKKLDAQDQLVVDTWYQAHLRPQQSLKTLANAADDERTRKIIVHALVRLARKNSLSARDLWIDLEHKFEFDQDQKNQINRRIALSAAYQHLPIASDLLSALPAGLKNDQVHLWLARIYLRNQKWQQLIDTIEMMPVHLSQENEWQYWLARSFESLEFELKSSEKFEFLATKSSYYGFLAADKMKLPYHIVQENAATFEDFTEAEFLAENPYLLRARELYFLDRPVDARREWFQALRHLDPEEIKKAAVLASSWKWYDSAIRTVAKTSHRSDYSLRFPTPFKQQVFNHADARQLDPSVIYGVMRRESLFDPMARSSVGALGLMQLMPSTARRVAKSLGMKRPRRSDILQIDNNINFGTQYFKMVLNRFENNVSLAAAAYNAGSLNVRKWLPQIDLMPADLWVETVPFKETRNYVQAVLAYATVFDKSLGRDTLISSRMDDIKSKY